MKITRVAAVYYSAAGGTASVVDQIANAAAQKLNVPVETFDFTLPAARECHYAFTSEDLVIFGTPVYAGKVPNKMLPYIQSGFTGNGALAVPVVTFGNRSFDNGLAELAFELENNGFHTIAGAAIVMRHVFSPLLAPDRPNEQDKADILAFAAAAAQKAAEMANPCAPVEVPGDHAAPYYVPKGTDGKPAVFLKAKPVTDEAKCNSCGKCAAVCPVGSIPADAPATCPGLCIKCQACVKACPTGAKHFEDPAFLSHVAMLEQNFTRPASSTFIV